MGSTILAILIGEIPYENQSRGVYTRISRKVVNFHFIISNSFQDLILVSALHFTIHFKILKMGARF